MSSQAPTETYYAGGGGGGGKRQRRGGWYGGSGGGRGGGGGGPRREPTAKFTMLDMGPDGKLRALLVAMLAVANLGDWPYRKLIEGGNRATGQLPYSRPAYVRLDVISQWLRSGCAEARHPVAQMFFDLVRIADRDGLWQPVLQLVTEHLTNAAIAKWQALASGEDDSRGRDSDDSLPDMSRGRGP